MKNIDIVHVPWVRTVQTC